MNATTKCFTVGPEKQAAFLARRKAERAARRISLIERMRTQIATCRKRGQNDLADSHQEALDGMLAS